MTTNVISGRNTKYAMAIKGIIGQLGHVSNAEIHSQLLISYPDVSLTTVHRTTSRLLDRGLVQLAPSGSNNVLRFDANTKPHDHFMCETCNMLKDADLTGAIRTYIEDSVGDGCSISGNLVVSGICKKCKEVA